MQSARAVVLKRKRWVTDGGRGGLFARELLFEVAFKCILKKTVVVDGEPVKDFLLFLRTDTVVSVKIVKELGLGLFKHGVRVTLKMTQIGKDALFKLFAVGDLAAKGLEAEGEAADNVGACDEVDVPPYNTADLLLVRKRVTVDAVFCSELCRAREQKVLELDELVENVCEGDDGLGVGGFH